MGVILYELLAQRHPFFSETSVGYAYHDPKTLAPPISKFNPEANLGLRAVAEQLLEKKPEKRYSTADDVISAIKEAVKGLDVKFTAPPSPDLGSAPPPFQMSKDPLFAPG